MFTAWMRLLKRQTVRPRSSVRIPVLVCALMFAVTAVVVNRWGRERWIPVSRQTTYTATAYAVETRNRREQPPLRSPTSIRGGPRRSAGVLAERYAAERVAEWRRNKEDKCRKARDVAEKARQECRENAARLAAFERQRREGPSLTDASRKTDGSAGDDRQPRLARSATAGRRPRTAPRSTAGGSHAAASVGAGDRGAAGRSQGAVGGDSATNPRQPRQERGRSRGAGDRAASDRRSGRERIQPKARRTDRGARKVASGVQGGRACRATSRVRNWQRRRNSSSSSPSPCKTRRKSTTVGGVCSGRRSPRAC